MKHTNDWKAGKEALIQTIISIVGPVSENEAKIPVEIRIKDNESSK